MRTVGAIMGGLAGIALAGAALAADWQNAGEGTVTIGDDTGTWWVPEREQTGPQWRVEGSGMFAILAIDAVPAPVAQPAMPKPSLRVEIMAPALRPGLTGALYTAPDGTSYNSDEGTAEATETDTGWRVSFEAELHPLDPATWEPVTGADPLPVRGTFDLTAP